MKKIFSMFLIFIMVLPSLLVSAEYGSCIITFDAAVPTYNIDGTNAFISGHHNDNAPVTEINNQSGWSLSPTNGYSTICINLSDSFMNNLSGTRDVLMDIYYYDGSEDDEGSKFCVYYVSQNLINEDAGVVTLGGSETWKTHTFVLENPRLIDVGEAPLRNISVSVASTYMGTSKGEVVIGSAEIYYGDERELLFELDSENVGNIFFNHESIELNMMLENPNAVNHGMLTVKLTLTNESNGSEYQTEKTISVGNSAELTQTINLDDLNLPYGIYDVSADIYSGNTLIASDQTELSRISAMDSNEPTSGSYNNSFLGINTHAARYSTSTVEDLVYLAARSGVGFIRTNISWESVERSADTYKISEAAQTLVQEAKKNNLKLMCVLGNSNLGVYRDYKPWRTGSTEENFQNYLEKYTEYIKYMVTELKDYVECWEIYNEYTIDYPGYNYSNADVSAAAARDYADILKAGYDAVKSIDPDACVIGGAHEGKGAVDNFAGRLYDTFGVADYMDVHSFHAYCSGSDTSGEANALNTYKNRFKGYSDAYGGKQQIYLDEFNCVTTGRLSVEEQAIYNLRLLTKERYLGDIDRIYSYNLESYAYGNAEGYGFVERPEDDYDYLAKTSAARPNYAVFAFMNKLLRLSDAIEFTEQNGNYIYEFYDNIHERPVYVIWNKTDSDSVTSSVTIGNSGTELSSYDMYGNKLGTAEGSITVPTGKKPVYVAGPEKDFLEGDEADDYKVTYNGTGTAGNNVSIVVLKKGLTEDDFDSVGQILYADQSVIDPGGEYSFTFKITQGNGEYVVLLTEENGERFVYNLSYNAGNLRVGYELVQGEESVKNFASLADGNLDINYRIDNPENKKTGFNIFGCLYKGDTLVDVVKSPDAQLAETDLIKTGSLTIPDVKKSEIDKVQILILDGTNNLKPLYHKFVLE